MKKSFHFQLSMLAFIFLFFSCAHSKEILLSEKDSENQTIEISTFRFKSKGEWINQVETRIINKEGKWLYTYHITSICGCLTKTDYRIKKIIHYKAADHLNYDIPLDSTDKFVFLKLNSLPGIEEYCSKNMLSSVKGSIKIN